MTITDDLLTLRGEKKHETECSREKGWNSNMQVTFTRCGAPIGGQGRMYAGVIRDLDPQGYYGLIESDEGEIVLFSRKSLHPNSESQALRIGQRVEFMIDAVDPAPHATCLKPERHH